MTRMIKSVMKAIYNLSDEDNYNLYDADDIAEYLGLKLEVVEKIIETLMDAGCLEDLTRFEMMHEQTIFEKALIQAESRARHLHHIYNTIDENEEYEICSLCGDEIGTVHNSVSIG